MPVLLKSGTLSMKAFPTPSPSLTDVCHVSPLKLFFGDKLAVDTSLISSYKYSNRSLAGLSPFYICSNQLHPMQRGDYTNIIFLYCIPKINLLNFKYHILYSSDQLFVFSQPYSLNQLTNTFYCNY